VTGSGEPPVAPGAPLAPGAPGPRAPYEEDPYRLRPRTVAVLVGGFLALALGALSTLIGLPYVVLKPGAVNNTLGTVDGRPLISVSGAPTYPAEGALDFTTVRVRGGPGFRVTVWDLLRAGLSKGEEVEPEELYFPEGVTNEQIQEENAAEMADSKQEATAVALKALDKKVVTHIVVGRVTDDSPNKGVLKAGDRIASIDGKAVASSDAVREAIGAHKPGEPVALGLVRDGKPVTVQANTKDTDGRTTIGVFLGVTFDFPFKVSIDVGDVGGPSAGMMFALGLYDTLTPGSLTGGQKVAGTGTIDHTGAVGPIGGIRQKLVGAVRGGAKWFLAPASNCDEVVGNVPEGIRVVRVENFDQALDSVEAIADGEGQSLPTCTR
jgi:PDZ domain-containing protein